MSKIGSTSATGASADIFGEERKKGVEEEQERDPGLEEDEEEEDWEVDGSKPEEMLQEDEAVNQLEEDVYGKWSKV